MRWSHFCSYWVGNLAVFFSSQLHTAFCLIHHVGRKSTWWSGISFTLSAEPSPAFSFSVAFGRFVWKVCMFYTGNGCYSSRKIYLFRLSKQSVMALAPRLYRCVHRWLRESPDEVVDMYALSCRHFVFPSQLFEISGTRKLVIHLEEKFLLLLYPVGRS